MCVSLFQIHQGKNPSFASLILAYLVLPHLFGLGMSLRRVSAISLSWPVLLFPPLPQLTSYEIDHWLSYMEIDDLMMCLGIQDLHFVVVFSPN